MTSDPEPMPTLDVVPPTPATVKMKLALVPAGWDCTTNTYLRPCTDVDLAATLRAMDPERRRRIVEAAELPVGV